MCSRPQVRSTFKREISCTPGAGTRRSVSVGRSDAGCHNSTSTNQRPRSGPHSRPGSAGRSQLCRAGSAVACSSGLSNATSVGPTCLEEPVSTKFHQVVSSHRRVPSSNSSTTVEPQESSRPSSQSSMSSNEGAVGDTLEQMGISSLVVAATLSRLSPGATVKDALRALCREPDLQIDEPKDFWECPICFESQQTCGWQCPEGHRFCKSCMRHHVKAVAFPRCPQVKCGYELDVTDLRLLKMSRKRVEAFENGKLQTAIETLGYEGSSGTRKEKIVHCRKDSCSNVMLVPQSDCRQCFACPCGAPTFCTQCGETPYHFHADCKQVKELRESWLPWVSEARTTRKRQAEAFAVLQKRISEDRNLHQDEVWKMAHCKLCPQCNRVVEKLDGCNSMRCGQDFHGGSKQSGCGATFDWTEALPYTPQAAAVRPKQLPENHGKGILHPGISCKVCNQVIFGPRLRCIHCESFDVCASCEAGLDTHDLSHVFEVIYKADFDWSTLVFPPGLTIRVIRNGRKLPPRWCGNQFECKVGEVVGEVASVTDRDKDACSSTAIYKVKIRGHRGSDAELPAEHLLPVFTSRWEADRFVKGIWKRGMHHEPRPQMDYASFQASIAAEGVLVACRRLSNRY